MSPRRYALVQLAVMVVVAVSAHAQSTGNVRTLSVERLELRNVKADAITYKGYPAVRLVDVGAPDLDDAGRLAIVRGTSFTDGTIEVDLTGDTGPNAAENLRGFVGVAFRVATDASRFECFYLRPKNGRSQDQLQRNHSVQYISIAGFPWQKLRSEAPGKYESYVDLVPGEWTKVKIIVSGEGSTLCKRGCGAGTHCERFEAGSGSGHYRTLDRTRHNCAFRQLEDRSAKLMV